MCSDGIHDNFDPKILGLSPKEVDSKLTGDKWNDDDLHHIAARNKYVRIKLQKVLQEYKNEKRLKTFLHNDVNDALNSFVQNSSLKRKLHMMETEGREPESYKDYPGKLDHAGLIVYLHP